MKEDRDKEGGQSRWGVTEMNDQPRPKVLDRLGKSIVLPVTVLGIAAAIALFGWWITDRGDDDSSSGGGSKTVSVLYEVEGTAESATITAQMPTGTTQASGKAVPLTRTDGTRGIKVDFPREAFVYISAQNEGASGDITCRITVDGVVVSENTASGGYTIATCQGTS
jgi:hypothetical protein